MIASEARGAWQDIEQRLRPYVSRRVASAGDVEDVLQEIFVRIHRGLAALRDGESFGGWVYRIAQSCIADAARARARSPVQIVDEPPETAAPAAEESEDLESELGACVALFVARLPAPYREAVTLTELQGLTQKDAAQLLGVTLPAMKSRTLRGRERSGTCSRSAAAFPSTAEAGSLRASRARSRTFLRTAARPPRPGRPASAPRSPGAPFMTPNPCSPPQPPSVAAREAANPRNYCLSRRAGGGLMGLPRGHQSCIGWTRSI
jgi:RNA polymerase sigma-70 factor (ECF subfamily)